MVLAGRETGSLMRQISSGAGMNSRATGQRSHKRRIGSREAVSGRDGMIEAVDQGEQRRVGHRFIPVIESGAERLLAPHGADDGAEDDRHPQQRGKAFGKADAGEGSEHDQNAHSQDKANEHLGRFQFSR